MGFYGNNEEMGGYESKRPYLYLILIKERIMISKILRKAPNGK